MAMLVTLCALAVITSALTTAAPGCEAGSDGECSVGGSDTSSLLQMRGAEPETELGPSQENIAGTPAAAKFPFKCIKLDDVTNIGAAVAEFGVRKLFENSKVLVFPIAMVDSVNLSSLLCAKIFQGSLSYHGIKLPNLVDLHNYVPYSEDEETFFKEFETDLVNRGKEFEKQAGQLQNMTGATVHSEFHAAAKAANSQTPAAGKLLWTQGHEGEAWKGDDFAGQLIGHTLFASLLEPGGNGNGAWVLDLTGGGSSTAPIQVMKRQVVAQIPSSLLKVRAHFDSSPALIKIEVYDPNSDKAVLEFDKSSGLQWEVAKMVFFAIALYVLECYHTGIHLFQAATIAAIKATIPAGTWLGEALKPQSILVLIAMLEQAAILHTDHDHAASFNGGIWQTDNLTQVLVTTRDMARFYGEYTPHDFLGTPATSPEWWAGMSSSFIAPIEKFANAMAEQVFDVSWIHLKILQAKLKSDGLVTPQSAVDVTTKAGLAKFLLNMIFVPSICHTHMYATREFFTPLMGWSSTVEFLDFLGKDDAGDNKELSEVLADVFPDVSSQQRAGFTLAFGTGSGFSDFGDKKVPQLGDGPYRKSPLSQSVSDFQTELTSVRKSVYAKFGSIRKGSWLPGYFYPKDVTVPFGFGLTQTTYI